MRFFWVKDLIRQSEFYLYWIPGKDNRADYFTKNHSPYRHKEIRSLYLYNSLQHFHRTNTRSRYSAVFHPANENPV